MMSNLKTKIIDLIQRNRISSTEVADALGKSGVQDHLNALVSGHFRAGSVKYVYGFDESNWPIHEQIQNINENCIVYVDTFNCNNKAAFGDLVSKYLILYQKAQAIVVNGLVRDNHILYKERYPIWCRGVTPLGCFNKEVTPSTELLQEVENRKQMFDDGILICDDSGCTLIQPNQITQDLYNRLEFIEMQEDIWFYCLDTLKWSTYETVCLKNYLNKPEVLPEGLRAKLSHIDLEN